MKEPIYQYYVKKLSRNFNATKKIIIPAKNIK